MSEVNIPRREYAKTALQDVQFHERRLLWKDQKPCVRACIVLRHSRIALILRNRMGAIERAKLDDEEPNISYEALVDDLDVGDSFTTQLIEVLVKVRHGSF